MIAANTATLLSTSDSFVLNHSIPLTSLKSNTTYYFQVSSIAEDLTTTAYSDIKTFKTLKR